MRFWPGLVGAVLVAVASASADDRVTEQVELTPEAPAPWGLRNVAAAVSSVFGAWSYWYGENDVFIDTVPADARVELFYIRANFQRGFARASSPVRVRVPPRVRATSRDSLRLRVSSPGFRSREEAHRILDLPDRILMTLDPLPNTLVFVGHAHLGDRTTLTLRTTEKPEFRVMKTRGSPFFTLILVETANKLDPVPSLAGGLVRNVEVTQVGEDVALRVETEDPQAEVRSKTGFDPLREEHIFSLDLTRADSPPRDASRIRGEISAVGFEPGNRCDAVFEDALRGGLESPRSSRSMPGTLADLYRREAMLRLGRLDGGAVHTLSGESLRTGSAIELEAALQTALSVRGYLSLLGAYARTQDDPSTVLRSLLAPDVDPAVFAALYEGVEEAWRACRQGELD